MPELCEYGGLRGGLPVAAVEDGCPPSGRERVRPHRGDRLGVRLHDVNVRRLDGLDLSLQPGAGCVRDRDGNWTYGFAVVVDDLRQGVDLVIRGRDLLGATAAQIRLDQDPRRGARNSLNFVIGVGRLGQHISAPQATSELNAIARRLQERFPVANARKRGVRMVATTFQPCAWK